MTIPWMALSIMSRATSGTSSCYTKSRNVRQHDSNSNRLSRLSRPWGERPSRPSAASAQDPSHCDGFYSPPRISALAKELPSYGIAQGLALDLIVPDGNGEPWGFSRPSMRAKAEKLLDAQAPMWLVGLPMCTPFSTWQFISIYISW